MTITVTLDDFTFQDFEVPDKINFGGAQMLALHRMIGGARVIDSMGNDDDPLEWSGRFRGADAAYRARTLDAKRRAGKPLSLTWGQFSKTVVIRHFRADQENEFEVPYTISVEVVSDSSGAIEPGTDEMVASDQESIDDIAPDLADDELTADVGSMDTAILAVPSFTSADLPTLQGVINTVATAQNRVTDLIADAEARLVSLAPLGVTLANPAAQLAGVVQGQVESLGDCYRLYDLENYLGRMSVNLESEAGILTPEPAISGTIRPPAPDFASTLAFSTGAGGQTVITASPPPPPAPVQTTFDFPDWPTDFVGDLDFPI